jgi:hypothetical protein
MRAMQRRDAAPDPDRSTPKYRPGFFRAVYFPTGGSVPEGLRNG